MKIYKTFKTKLLLRILSVVVIGTAALGILGSYQNFHSTQSTLETTLSELALQTSVRLENRLSRYVAIVKEVGMDPRMGEEYSVAQKLELLQERADTYGFSERGYIDKDGWGYETLDDVIDYREDHCYIKGMKNEEFVFGPQLVGDRPIIYFCAPIQLKKAESMTANLSALFISVSKALCFTTLLTRYMLVSLAEHTLWTKTVHISPA